MIRPGPFLYLLFYLIITTFLYHEEGGSGESEALFRLWVKFSEGVSQHVTGSYWSPCEESSKTLPCLKSNPEQGRKPPSALALYRGVYICLHIARIPERPPSLLIFCSLFSIFTLLFEISSSFIWSCLSGSVLPASSFELHSLRNKCYFNGS